MKNKVIIGLIIVTIGIFLLLANLGIINHNVFYNILNLWPLLLIVIGINVIFRDSRIVSYITWGLFFLIIIIYGIFSTSREDNTNLDNHNIVMERKEETGFANLTLDLGASRLNINSTEDDLLTANLSGTSLDYSEVYRNGNEYVDIGFKSRRINIIGIQGNGNTHDFNLNKDIIWDLDLDLGDLSGHINLEDIPVRSIDLDSGATNLTVSLGNKHDLEFSIDAGASNLELIIPEDVGLRIKLDTGLSSNNIESLNLNYNEDYYSSSNYENAHVKIHIDIDVGVGRIDFSYK